MDLEGLLFVRGLYQSVTDGQTEKANQDICILCEADPTERALGGAGCKLQHHFRTL